MATTTYYNAQYARGNLISFVTVNGVKQINIFDPRILKAVLQIQSYQTYTYSDGDKIVNISYQAYATTSLWWVILMYNGLIHPYEIPIGYLLKIPDMSELVANITPAINSIGQVVSI